MKNLISRLAILTLAALLPAPEARAQVLSLYYVERSAAGAFPLVPLGQVSNDQIDTLGKDEERILDVYATEFYIGDLPDIRDNDVSLTIASTTDVTRKERLGDAGSLSLTLAMKEDDDTRVEGFQARALLRNIPFRKDLELKVALWELDGVSKDRVEAVKEILVSETGDDKDTLINLDLGNPYVQLAMAVYDAVVDEKQKNDKIWNSSLSFNINPPVGLMPLKQGEWVLITTEARKPAYRIDPLTDVTYDGDRLILTEDATSRGKKMPSHLILSVVVGKQAVPPTR